MRGNRGGNYREGGYNQGSRGGGYGQGSSNGDFGSSRGGGSFSRGGGSYQGRGGSGGPRGGSRAPTSRSVAKNTGDAQFVNDIAAMGREPVVFNGRPLDLTKMAKVGKYSLKFEFKHPKLGKMIDMSEDRDNDVSRNIRRSTINELYKLFLMLEDVRPKDGEEYFFAYDRAQTLYSNFYINEGRYGIRTTDLSDAARRDILGVDNVTADVSKPYDLTTANYQEINRFLEILSQQTQFDDSSFAFYENGVFNFSTMEDFDSVNSGLLIAKGHHKNVVKLDAAVGNVSSVLFLNPKQSLFHREGSLLDYLNFQFGCTPATNFRDENLRNQLVPFLKNLIVYPTYAERRRFMIKDLSYQDATTTTFVDNKETQLSVAAYYKSKYGKDLLYPHLPCVIQNLGEKDENEVRKKAYYPMEVLNVVRGQRVKRSKMSNTDEAGFIKRCQLHPTQLLENFESQLIDSRISNEGSDYMNKAGINIGVRNYEQECSVLFPPQIEYKNSAVEIIAPASEWRIERDTVYKEGATINHLMFIHLNMYDRETENFRTRFIERAASLGVVIRRTECKTVNINDSVRLIKGIAGLKEEKPSLDYIMLLGDIHGAHNYLKASELSTPVVTQQVMRKTITNPKLGDVTITNLLNKMNLKAGGINFGMSTSQNQMSSLNTRSNINHGFFLKTMVFGLDMSSMGAVSSFEKDAEKENRMFTYGYAYTTNIDGNTTRGGYFYCCNEKPPLSHDILRQPIVKALEDYYKIQDEYPKFLIVYRKGGDTEAALDALDVEFKTFWETMKSVLTERNVGETPGLAYIAVTRKHNVRMAKFLGSQYGNVQPGTCVSSGIVKADDEFILVPHSSPLGTAKPFKAVIVNTFKIPHTKSALEQMTLNLCYNFEIVTKSINLPTPLRCAGLFAERGRNNYNTLKDELEVKGQKISKEYSDAVTMELKARIDTRYNA